MAIIEREAALVTKVGSDQVLLLPYTNIANVEGGVASVNGVTPDTSGAVTMPVATATLASTVRLYSTTGSATDGSLTQAALTAALNSKLDASGTAVKATADASGNVITSTYATKAELTETGEAAVEVAQDYTDAQIAANKYTLPTATDTDLGGVKVGSNITIADGVIAVADATTASKGVIQLSSATNSDSTTLAATASAVKTAYDLANSKQSPATTLAGYGISDAYTKSEVDTKVAGLVDSAPEALNTLNELAAALGDDPNFATTISTEIGKKANIADLATVATSGNYADLLNTPTIPVIPDSLPAEGGNADTVNGFTVEANVPADAKFTDTVYTHPSHTAKTSGLYKITVDELGHVSAATTVVKSDITDLGIPAQDTVYTHPDTHPATMITGLADVATSGSYNDLADKPAGLPSIGGNADTVNGFTVETNVPADAVFTDTVYTHPATHPATMITGLANVATSGSYNDLADKPAGLPSIGGNADTVNGFTVEANVPADAVFTDTIYTLPEATTTVLGGVKVGTNIAVSNGVISVADGSTSAKGVLQLTNSTSSTSTTTAATPAAVKSAYDLANAKQSPATTLAGYGITNAYTKTEVDNKVAGLVDSAPEALNTLNELAAALGDDPNFATTIAGQIGAKANTADLATVATSGNYNDLSNKPTIPTSLPANGGNAATVNGHTVNADVPSGAKFTDTVYTHPTYTAKSSGLYKITVNNLGHVSGATAVAKSDITGLGIPAQDTTYSAASTSTAGLMSAADKTKLDGIAAGANAYSLPTASGSTLGGVKTTSTVTSTSGLTACPIISGVPYYKDTNTTYTLSSFGITATAAELNALDGITATVTELNYCDGVTSNIQTQLNGKLSTTGKAVSATVADSANAVAWANVSGKPSIPAVTKVTFTATDSRWGTASNGKYPLTIAASGGEFLNCYRTNGSVYDKMDVSVTVSGNNIIIYSLDKFAGYMTYIK